MTILCGLSETHACAALRGEDGADLPALRGHLGMARAIREATAEPGLIHDPLLYVDALALDLVAVPFLAVEVTATATKILYVPHPDPRVEGWLLLQGVVLAYLQAEDVDFTPTDFALVLAALAVPLAARSLPIGQLMMEQRWAPEWFLRLVRRTVAAA